MLPPREKKQHEAVYLLFFIYHFDEMHLYGTYYDWEEHMLLIGNIRNESSHEFHPLFPVHVLLY